MTQADGEANVRDGWREIASGAGFVEGPVEQGEYVDFVSINRGLVYRARIDGGGYEARAELGAGPNGAAVDADGRLWVVQNGARVMDTRSELQASPGIQVVGLDSSVTVELGLDDLYAPNDCAFGPDGRLWFTDPYGRLMSSREGDPDRTSGHGRLWAYDCVSHDLELIADHLHHPNGLCFDADGDTLFISHTKTREISVLDAGATGIRQPRPIAILPNGQPDGIALDVAGRLWIAATDADGIALLSPNGKWDFVDLGTSFPTNLCFAGPDLSTVVVTAARGGRVLARDIHTAGLPLRCGV